MHAYVECAVRTVIRARDGNRERKGKILLKCPLFFILYYLAERSLASWPGRQSSVSQRKVAHHYSFSVALAVKIRVRAGTRAKTFFRSCCVLSKKA